MGIKDRRERERESRKEAIFRAAMDVYLKEGYHSVTMEKIAESSELSRATLYLYFNTKDEIFVHGIVNRSQFFGDLLEKILERRSETGRDILGELWQGFKEFYNKDPATFDATLYFHQGDMLRNLPGDLRSLLDQSGSRNYKLLCAIMAFGVEQGFFTPCDPRTLAEVVWSAFLGIVHLENSKAAMNRKAHMGITWDLAQRVLAEGILKDSAI